MVRSSTSGCTVHFGVALKRWLQRSPVEAQTLTFFGRFRTLCSMHVLKCMPHVNNANDFEFLFAVEMYCSDSFDAADSFGLDCGGLRHTLFRSQGFLPLPSSALDCFYIPLRFRTLCSQAAVVHDARKLLSAAESRI